jgi:4-oxalomesaconate tautomerase
VVLGLAPNNATDLDIEHPTGFFTVTMAVEGEGADIRVRRSALLRTARKLMTGEVFVPASIWNRNR